MNHHSRRIAVAAGVGLIVGLAGWANAQAPAPHAGKSALENFGFTYGFSTDKMDPGADPRKDFRRYAAGRWMDAATIPSDTVRISSLDVLTKRVEVQVGQVLDDAARASPAAAKGSPTQQVGDYYAAGMDEKRLSELGVAPIKPEFERIAAAEGRQGFVDTLARLATVTNDVVFFGPVVSTDNNDRRRYALYIVDAELPLGLDNYLKPENQKIRDAYVEADRGHAGDRGQHAGRSRRGCGEDPRHRDAHRGQEVDAGRETRPGEALRDDALRRGPRHARQRRPGRAVRGDGRTDRRARSRWPTWPQSASAMRCSGSCRRPTSRRTCAGNCCAG